MTAAGLKDVYKGFNLSGDALVERLRAFRRARRPRARLVHLRACRAIDRDLRRDRRRSPSSADITFAQFVLLTPFPGTIDFEKWAARNEGREPR